MEKLPESNRAVIIRMKFQMKCLRCGSEWGIYIDPVGKLPVVWDVCFKCTAEGLDKIEREKESKND
jgi:hypothetical protein